MTDGTVGQRRGQEAGNSSSDERRRKRDGWSSALDGECAEGNAVLLFFEQLYLHFSVFQAVFAELYQLVALFEFREQIGQRYIARFHGFNDSLELAEGVFE